MLICLAYFCWDLERFKNDAGMATISPASDYVVGFGHTCCAACKILVPRLRIEPAPSVVKTQSPNHWTTGEFPILIFIDEEMEAQRCDRN